MAAEFVDMEKKLAEMPDEDFAALMARTRPPKLDPKDRAQDVIRKYLGVTD